MDIVKDWDRWQDRKNRYELAALLRCAGASVTVGSAPAPVTAPVLSASPVRSVAAAARVLRVRRASITERLQASPVALHGTRPHWPSEDAVRRWWNGEAPEQHKPVTPNTKEAPPSPMELPDLDWEDF